MKQDVANVVLAVDLKCLSGLAFPVISVTAASDAVDAEYASKDPP